MKHRKFCSSAAWRLSVQCPRRAKLPSSPMRSRSSTATRASTSQVSASGTRLKRSGVTTCLRTLGVTPPNSKGSTSRRIFAYMRRSVRRRLRHRRRSCTHPHRCRRSLAPRSRPLRWTSRSWTWGSSVGRWWQESRCAATLYTCLRGAAASCKRCTWTTTTSKRIKETSWRSRVQKKRGMAQPLLRSKEARVSSKAKRMAK
mmetsp:Transcript_27896/g.46735  ORF Transcript_27896/g.46735 Transcript_27896/m.46735 type:complete len:201 (-) Transcript_27896:51-653(-)